MTAILPPLFVQVALTFGLAGLLAALRFTDALTDKAVAAKVKAGDKQAYRPAALLVAENFNNQFQVPVLFYTAVLLAVATGPVADGFVMMAWVFAVSRIAHALVHCTVNIILLRFATFLVGVISAAAMWWHLFDKLMAG